MKFYELITSANIAEYWLTLNAEKTPTLGETLFPYTKEIGLKLEWIKGANNQPVSLKLSAFDSKAIRRDGESFEVLSTRMPFFKESVYIDEERRQQLNTMLQTNNVSLVNSIVEKIFANQMTLIRAAYIALERMRMQVLTTGTIAISSNGQSYNYDFGMPSENKKEVAISWSTPTADIIGELNEYKAFMKSKGVNITRGVCNTSVAKTFLTNTAMKNAIYVFAGGTVNITENTALSYIQNMTGITIVVDDEVYVNEDKTVVKYVPDNTLVLIPDGTLGQTHLGTTPEESDLMASSVANVSLIENAIAVTTSQLVDPVNVETKVSMIGMPSFERANEVLIIDTVK